MGLYNLSDRELHQKLKSLVACERELLTKILRHLKEIERRRLYCDFGCSSLFDYAQKHLGYSEAEAFHRIRAMRLLKELPQLEKKIAGGQLSLTNICRAQSLFNKVEKSGGEEAINREEKLDLLKKLEEKSTRQGEREIQNYLEKKLPGENLPTDRERELSKGRLAVNMVIDETTRENLEKVRSLLGPKGASIDYNTLINEMAKLSARSLEEKRFGKRRVRAEREKNNSRAGSKKAAITEDRREAQAATVTMEAQVAAVIEEDQASAVAGEVRSVQLGAHKVDGSSESWAVKMFAVEKMESTVGLRGTG